MNSIRVEKCQKMEEKYNKPILSNKDRENGLWHSVLESILDPTKGMTEEEKMAYRARIMAKLESGKSLTEEEKNFLQLYDQALYQIAMRVEVKKSAVKEQLKHCKSKEEVSNVIQGAMSAIDKDPNKEYVAAAIADAENEYKKSGVYSRLPDTKKEAEGKTGKKVNIGMVIDTHNYTQNSQFADVLCNLEDMAQFNVEIG